MPRSGRTRGSEHESRQSPLSASERAALELRWAQATPEQRGEQPPDDEHDDDEPEAA